MVAGIMSSVTSLNAILWGSFLLVMDLNIMNKNQFLALELIITLVLESGSEEVSELQKKNGKHIFHSDISVTNRNFGKHFQDVQFILKMFLAVKLKLSLVTIKMAVCPGGLRHWCCNPEVQSSRPPPCDLLLSSPKFKSLVTLCKLISQLVCLLPVGIYNCVYVY